MRRYHHEMRRTRLLYLIAILLLLRLLIHTLHSGRHETPAPQSPPQAVPTKTVQPDDR